MTVRVEPQPQGARTNVLAWYTLAWIPMMFIGIVNGIARTMGYARYMSELVAHQVSVVTGIALLGSYVWLLVRRRPLQSARQALSVGGIWLGLTILFEFVFGHYVVGHPWSALLHDYNVLAGRLWVLVLGWTGIAPYVFYRLTSRDD